MGSGASSDLVTQQQKKIDVLKREANAREQKMADLEKQVKSLAAAAAKGSGGGSGSPGGGGGRPSAMSGGDVGGESKTGGPSGDKTRRGEISAEAMGANLEAQQAPYQKKTVPKDDATRALIVDAVNESVMFANLREEERLECVDAFEMEKHATGEKVIEQGDPSGNNLYIVASGTCGIFVSQNGAPPIKFGEVGKGKSFGELALLYNTPRAATVRVMQDATL